MTESKSDINSMTLQEIFDKSVAGLAAQNFQIAMNVFKDMCAYLAEDGKRCAYGHLIPDGHPALNVNGSCRTVWEEYPELEPKDANARMLIADLQIAHDHANDPEHMKERLRVVATENRLQIPDSLALRPESV